MLPIVRLMMLAGALAMLLTACGLKGPLYLPKKSAPPVVVPASNASQPSNTNSAVEADADKQTDDAEASSRSSANTSGK